jgi:hypothetical protein
MVNCLYFQQSKKPYFRQFTPAGFVASMKPLAFEGTHFKKWHVRAVLWFQTMKSYDANKGKPERDLFAAQEESFQKVDTLFKAALLAFLGTTLFPRICHFIMERTCGMRPRPSLGSRTLEVRTIL